MKVTAFLLAVPVLAGRSPEVGSEARCEDRKAKPTGAWTANEAGDSARHCIFN